MTPGIRLSLRALRAFAATVEHGSITAAARALNIAPSAVAAALDQVEAEFGADLLIRTRARGIAATPEGLRMADRFRGLLEEYHDIMEEGREIALGLTGTLRIGYYAPVAPAFLPRILCPVMQANPDLRLELFEHDNDSAQEALLAGRLDLILFAAQDLRRGIETRPLLDLAPYVLAPDGHPVARLTRVSLSELARHPIVQLDLPLARPYVDRLFAAEGLTPEIAARANSTEMVRSLVGAGAGLAVLLMRPFTDMSYGGDRLISLPLEADHPGLQLVSGRVAGRPRRLVAALLEELHGWMNSKAAARLTIG